MLKVTLEPAGVCGIPMFSDEKGDLYIALEIPDPYCENTIVFYQRIHRNFDKNPPTFTIVGTSLEVYDTDMINIQLSRATMLLEEEVNLQGDHDNNDA